MAVIAKAEITISKIASVEKITRYYLLQSSTAAVPSKPADGSAISSNWSKTEPSYTSGSTNTLYFVDQTILSDSTIKYSEVSKSSSYEAAKEAWNKANNAQNTADSANDKIDGLQVGGRNLARQTAKAKTWTSSSTYAWDTWIGSDGGSGWLPSILIEPEQTYTLSFDYVIEDCTDKSIGVGIGAGTTGSDYAADTWEIMASFKRYGGNIESGHFVYNLSAKSPSQLGNKKYFAFRPARRLGDNVLTTPIKLTISNFKLEKGNKATDWTPAPEDYYTKTETDASIQVLSDKISQQVSTTDELGTRLSKVEQDSGSWSVTLETANAAKSAADKASQTASSASSTASDAKLTADNANKTASSAVSTASNAQKTAENAASTASSASSAATEAKNTADAANKTASNANSTASEAKKTADSANTTAGQAKSTADNASQTASSAKSAADKANENASSAVSTADTAKSTADTAKSTADTARQEASDAAKTATNFMGFDSNGLVVGDRTANTLGKNVLIGNDSVNIRNGSTVLAEFAEKLIAIGKESPDAVIDFLNGLFKISADSNGGAYLEAAKLLSIYADDAVDGTGDGSGHYSMITVGDTSMQLNTNNVGHIDIVNRNPTIGAIAQIISEVYGRNNENVSFIMETDKSTGRNIVGLDTGNGVYTEWKCNGSNTADINHCVKSSSGSTQIAQWDNSVRFLKNDNLMASYDGTTPVLLSTAAYPNADTTLHLSSPVSQQPHGIVLEFAPYVNSSPVGYGLATFFVPKSRNTGASVTFVIAGSSFNTTCCKWIYIHDDKIIGNDVNYEKGTHNGVTYNNAAYVLTKIYGV